MTIATELAVAVAVAIAQFIAAVAIVYAGFIVLLIVVGVTEYLWKLRKRRIKKL